MSNQNKLDSMDAVGELAASISVHMPRIIHPEPHTYYWTDKELEAIHAYAQAYAASLRSELEAARAAQGEPSQREKVYESLLKACVRQLSAWHSKYGANGPSWLPPGSDATLIQTIDDWLNTAAQPPSAAMQDFKFNLRGFLASELLCWHRLTEAEAQDIVRVFVANQSSIAQSEATGVPDSVSQPTARRRPGCRPPP